MCGRQGPLPGSAGQTRGQCLLGRPEGEDGSQSVQGSEVTQKEVGARFPCLGSSAPPSTDRVSLSKSMPITFSTEYRDHPGTGQLWHGMRAVVFLSSVSPSGWSEVWPGSCLSLPSAGSQTRYHTILIQTGGSISLSMTRNLGSEDVRPQPKSPCNWSPPQSDSLCPQVFYGFSTCSGTHLPQFPGIVLCGVLHGQGRIDSKDLAVWDWQL